MEYRDLYDENRNLTGERIEKCEPVPLGRYYVTVMVFIENSNGEMLLQKRSQPWLPVALRVWPAVRCCSSLWLVRSLA